MTTPIRLDLDRRQLELGAGEGARLNLRVRNTSDVVQHLRVEVRGLPDGARARSAPDTVRLLPAATADVAVDVELPATPLPDAGTHVLGVLAQSPHRHEVSRCEEVRLEVPARPALGLRVDPELVSARGRAAFTATASNTGNTPLTVTLRGSDPERRVQLRFQPGEVSLRPRSSADVVVHAAAPRAWTGQERRRPITLTARAETVDATATATMVQAPRISPAVLRSAGAALAVLVLAGALVARSVLQDDEPTAVTAPTEAPSAPPTPASAGPSASPGQSPSPTPTPLAAPSEAGTAAGAATAPTPAPTPTATATVTALPPSPRLVTFEGAAGGPDARFVEGDEWREQGVLLSALPTAGRVADGCAAATGLAAHGSGADVHVTAAATASPTDCNDTGLQLRFEDATAPVTDVALEMSDAGDYLVTTESADGQSATSAVSVAPSSLLIAVPSAGGLRSLAVAADPDGAQVPGRVALQRVRYTPASAETDGAS